MGPTAYAIVSTVRPNASETPSSPMPTFGKAAASTALPHPPSTSQNVPMNSADSFENTAPLLPRIGVGPIAPALPMQNDESRDLYEGHALPDGVQCHCRLWR